MMYLVRYEQITSRLKQSSITRKLQLSESFKNAILSAISDIKKNELWDVIYEQLISLERLSPQIYSTLMLDDDQYKIYDIFCNTWSFENEGKYPYFFMTESAETGKTFMTRKIVDMLNNKKINYLLMVS